MLLYEQVWGKKPGPYITSVAGAHEQTERSSVRLERERGATLEQPDTWTELVLWSRSGFWVNPHHGLLWSKPHTVDPSDTAADLDVLWPLMRKQFVYELVHGEEPQSLFATEVRHKRQHPITDHVQT